MAPQAIPPRFSPNAEAGSGLVVGQGALADRHDRQRRLPFVGAHGQEKLRKAKVVVVGVGALGSVQAELFVRAGVGHVVLIDRDVVEASNLQRQSLYTLAHAQVGRAKAEAAAEMLCAIDPELRVDAQVRELTAASADELLAGATLIADGTDNVETRWLLNEWAVRERVPYIYGGAVGTEGRVFAVLPEGPCLRCLFGEPPPPGELPTCDAVGVWGPLTHTVAAIQAGEALAWLLENCRPLRAPDTGPLASRTVTEAPAPGSASRPRSGGQLYTIEAAPWRFGQSRVEAAARDPQCPVCVERRFERLTATTGRQVEVVCGRDAVRIHPGRPRTLSASPGTHANPSVPPDAGGGTPFLTTLAHRLATIPHLRLDMRGALLRIHGISNPVAVHSAGGSAVGSPEHDVSSEISMTIFADGRALVEGTRDPVLARILYDRIVGG